MARKAQPAMQRTLTAPDPDALMEVYEAMAKMALKDYATLPHATKDYQTAAAWLERVGLLCADGTIDTRGFGKRRKA